jgi:hypothetical protein
MRHAAERPRFIRIPVHYKIGLSRAGTIATHLLIEVVPTAKTNHLIGAPDNTNVCLLQLKGLFNDPKVG